MYRSIAVATTFSPRFLALLSEAGRVSRHFKAPLQLIHAGEETEEKKTQFLSGLEKFGLPSDTMIHWVPGDPAITITEAARSAGVDLLISGALNKDGTHRPFANDIAKALISSAAADLFLFLRPNEEVSPVRNPAVLIDFSPTSAQLLRKTIKMAARQNCEKIWAFNIHTTFDEIRLRAAGDLRDPDERLEEFVLASTKLDVPVETKCIRGNTGFAACEFVQSIDVDLLGVPTGMPGLHQPVLNPTVDWLYQVIPCNLWIMRERKSEPKKKT